MGLFDRFRSDSHEPSLVQMKAKRGQSDDEAIQSALKKASDKGDTIVLHIGKNHIVVDQDTTLASAQDYLTASRNGVTPSISNSRELRAHEMRYAERTGDYSALAPDKASPNQSYSAAVQANTIGGMGATLVKEVEGFLRETAAFDDIVKGFKDGGPVDRPAPPTQPRNETPAPDQPKRGGAER